MVWKKGKAGGKGEKLRSAERELLCIHSSFNISPYLKPFHLSNHPSIHSSIHLSIHPSILHASFIHPSFILHPFIHSSIHPFMHPFSAIYPGSSHGAMKPRHPSHLQHSPPVGGSQGGGRPGGILTRCQDYLNWLL